MSQGLGQIQKDILKTLFLEGDLTVYFLCFFLDMETEKPTVYKSVELLQKRNLVCIRPATEIEQDESTKGNVKKKLKTVCLNCDENKLIELGIIKSKPKPKPKKIDFIYIPPKNQTERKQMMLDAIRVGAINKK